MVVRGKLRQESRWEKGLYPSTPRFFVAQFIPNIANVLLRMTLIQVSLELRSLMRM
jgi:hypothetical protein